MKKFNHGFHPREITLRYFTRQADLLATKRHKMHKKMTKKVLYKRINSAVERINYQLKYVKCGFWFIE